MISRVTLQAHFKDFHIEYGKVNTILIDPDDGEVAGDFKLTESCCMPDDAVKSVEDEVCNQIEGTIGPHPSGQ